MIQNIRQLKKVNSKKINIKIINIIPDEIEKFIIKKIKKNAPESYGQITDSELEYLEKQVFNTYKFNINKHIIASIKSGYMKNYIIKNHFNLKKNSKLILNRYPIDGVLNLSKQFNLSPMTIIRFVFDKIYHKKLKELILSKRLTSYDQEQFNLASQSDIYVTLEQVEQSDQSIKFEKLIEDFLIKNKIDYKTQEQLTEVKFAHLVVTVAGVAKCGGARSGF
jgi:hypothetical protein